MPDRQHVSPPRVHTKPAPRPLPPAWARVIANDIASHLRRGWRAHTVKRAVSSLGAPITGRDYTPAGRVPGPAPTSELVSRELFAWGVTDPVPRFGVPVLVWHLTQLDLAQALNERDLMRHAGEIDAWLKRRAPGPRPSVFTLRANRHGTLALRVNVEHATRDIASVFLTAAEAATVTVPDPLDAQDLMAEWDEMDPASVLGLEALGG